MARPTDDLSDSEVIWKPELTDIPGPAICREPRSVYDICRCQLGNLTDRLGVRPEADRFAPNLSEPKVILKPEVSEGPRFTIRREPRSAHDICRFRLGNLTDRLGVRPEVVRSASGLSDPKVISKPEVNERPSLAIRREPRSV